MPLRSLKALTLAFLALFLLVTTLTGFAVYRASLGTITSLVDKRIATESDAIAAPDDPAGRDAVLARIAVAMQQRDTGDLGFALRDASGRQIAGNVRIDRALPSGFSNLGPDDGIKGLSHGRALVRAIGDGMTLTTVAETEPFDNYNDARVRIYIFGFGSIVLVVMGGLVTFGIMIHSRIAAMRRAVDAIIDGDLQRRVPTDGSRNAFDQQAQAFNRMLDRIGALMATISNVSDDIAHDLRTPLARLRGQLEQLQRHADTPKLQEEVEEAIAQSDHLLAMFNAVLRIAEVDGGDRRAGFARLDLGALAEEVASMMEPVAAEADHVLTVATCTDAWIQGDRQLLTQALINLIENALRHTPPESRIAIGVTCAPDMAMLTVADNGPGIPAVLHERALRRFGRLDKSRPRAGHGLGLPLVDAIVRLHRGELVLENAEPGLRVVARLPLG